MKIKINLLIIIFSVLLVVSGFTQVTADFTADITSGCDLLTVHFTNSSTGTDLEYSWDFGNGSTSTNFEPTAIYNSPGSYDVSLIVNDGTDYDTLILVNYINYFNNGPTANLINLTDTVGCIPLLVEFQDLSEVGDTSISEWNWDFGDGQVSNEQHPSNTYTNKGIYSVSLKVIDENNCENLIVLSNFINATEQPEANFIADEAVTCNDSLEVSFTNLSAGYGVLDYEWNFGDGTSSIEENPTHTYNGLGTYNVKLVISDENDCIDSVIMEDYIQLIEILADFEIESDTICPNLNIPITNTSIGASSYIWNFGDGTVLIDENPEHFYTDSGQYIISLAVFSDVGCDAFSSDTVYVDFIKANFTADTSYSCQVPFTVQYINNSENAVSYEWHFGNRNYSEEINPQNTFELTIELENNLEASYTDTLYAISANGCQDIYHPITENVRIILPQAKFTPNDDDYENPSELSGCAPLEINFLNSSIFNSPFESIESYLWDFGDGETSNLDSVIKTFTDTNQFVVSLILTTTYNCVDTFLTTVKVGNPQAADFELIGPSVLCASVSAVFSDLSEDANYINAWQWIFGDGSNSSLQNPFHFFQDTGYLAVSLIAYQNGCPSDTIQKDSIVKILGPIGTFEIEINCNQPYNYNFIGKLSDYTNFSWDFGDGNFDTLNTTILHTYSDRDDYEVILSSNNSNTACSFEHSDIVKVRDLQASFTRNPSFGCPYLNVSFDPSNSSDYSEFEHNGETGLFLWKFGDSSQRIFSEDTLTDHIFESRGQFPVELILKSENGCLDTARSKVNIYQPVADFSVDDTVGCMPLTIEFTNTSISDTIISSYEWYFGDNNFSDQQNISHTFNEIGIFTIQLKATDILGCQDTIKMEDLITSSKPIPDFTTPDKFLCTGDTIVFASTSEGTIVDWLWNFGDNNTSANENPQYAWSDSGYFSVSLFLTDVFGCDSSLVKTDYIHVQAKPEADFIADNTEGACWPSTINFTDLSISPYIDKWRWDFGDGSSGSSVQNPFKIYIQPGSYDVNLQVETTYGCKDTVNKEAYINIIGAFADIFAPDTACPNVNVEFSIENQLNVLNFNWLFEDGSTSEDVVANHIFNNSGEQYTTLILNSFDASCPPKLIEDTVFIHKISAGFLTSDIAGCVPITIELTDTSINANTWLWNFGDGSVDEGTNVNHTYFNEGNYLLQEYIENEFNCKDTAEIEIMVFPLPDIQTSNDTLICTGDTVIINAQGGNIYQWSPSQGLTDPDIENPGALPSITTQYHVLGTDQNGCSNSGSILITVQQMPVISNIIQDTTVVIGEIIQLYANFDQGMTYYWTPQDELDFPDSLKPFVKIIEDIVYIFTVIDSNQCFEVTQDAFIKVRKVYSIDVPTAFTPNNDGNNDFIYAKGWGIFELIEYKIYNRLGKIVFISNDINEGWDGIYNGIKQPAGTYVYSVIIESYDGQQRSKTGSFLLLR